MFGCCKFSFSNINKIYSYLVKVVVVVLHNSVETRNWNPGFENPVILPNPKPGWATETRVSGLFFGCVLYISIANRATIETGCNSTLHVLRGKRHSSTRTVWLQKTRKLWNGSFCSHELMDGLMDSGSYTGALLRDLSKAFDSVPHQLLLREVVEIGCRV